jgi:hypothetical protein
MKQCTENVYVALFTSYYDDQINTDKMAIACKEKEILTKSLVLNLNETGLLEKVALNVGERIILKFPSRNGYEGCKLDSSCSG